MAPTLDEVRQAQALAFLASGQDLSFGDAAGCPFSLDELRDLRAESPAVARLCDGGLTAQVFKVQASARHPAGLSGASPPVWYAVKKARPVCLVQNADGATSFLNELRRHRELRELKEAGTAITGVIYPIWGSLSAGVIVSPWIDGEHGQELTLNAARDSGDLNQAGSQPAARTLRVVAQILDTACQLWANGFFEWDLSAGNILDDGEQAWLYDFGYLYRFDPATQFNSAGRGDDCPQFHPVERFETRNLFAQLLKVEETLGLAVALERFRIIKSLALVAYEGLVRPNPAGASAGATGVSEAWLQGIQSAWRGVLQAGDPQALARLYLEEAWRSHKADLDDDLHGKSCTYRTLERVDWLIRVARQAQGAEQSGLGASPRSARAASIQELLRERELAQLFLSH